MEPGIQQTGGGGARRLEGPGGPLGEGVLEVGQVMHAQPGLLARRAQRAEDLEYLVDLLRMRAATLG